MRKIISLLTVFIISAYCFASGKDSVVYYTVPDSVKTAAFFSEINAVSAGSKNGYAGIGNNEVKVLLEAGKKGGGITMQFPKGADVLVTGRDVELKNKFTWRYSWEYGKPYQLMIATAPDSVPKTSSKKAVP